MNLQQIASTDDHQEDLRKRKETQHIINLDGILPMGKKMMSTSLHLEHEDLDNVREMNDDENGVSTDSSDYQDEEEEEEEDDPIANLSEEQRALIAQRQAMLKQSFNDYAQAELETKVRDLVATTSISEEEAKLAIEYCGNDEFEAAQQITMEPQFLDTIREIILANRQNAELERTSPTCVLTRKDQSGHQNKVDIEIVPTTLEKQIKTGSSTKATNGTCRKAESGFRLNGEKRVGSLRLSDALKKLAKLRDKKLALNSHSSEDWPNNFKHKNGASKDKAVARRTSARLHKDHPSSTDSFSTPVEVIPTSQPNIKECIRDKENADGPRLESDPSEDDENEDSTEYDEIDYTADDLKKLNWSDARIKAFLGRKSNPNAYYYRFNDVNEDQETGEWTEENRKLFLELVKKGVDYRWGLFSMKIPGRVGYQCSNYYRKLIMEGVIKDPNYTYIDGKLKFERPKGLKRGPNTAKQPLAILDGASHNGTRNEQSSVGSGRHLFPKKSNHCHVDRRRKHGGKRRAKAFEDDDTVYANEIDSSDSDSEDGTYGYGGVRAGAVKRQKGSFAAVALKKLAPNDEPQLIPGLRCPMTFEPIYDPAISPYGHVMGYDTWLRVLGQKPKDTCPFTKQRLTRRMLVKLDSTNIDQYKDKIQKINTGVSVSAPKTDSRIEGD